MPPDDMSPEKWAQVDRIFHAALQRRAAERVSYLTEACGDNRVLRDEVESLLSAERRAGSFLEADAMHDSARLLSAKPRSCAGQKLNQYELLSLLGAGGMGEVYRARDTRLGRQVAIKILSPELQEDSDRLRRFEHEAHTASGLNHPNIITVYEIGESEYGRFLVMELVEGRTLRALTETHPSREGAVQICIQIAQALRVAHAAGIVHRDIKPENIMVRPDGYVKVLDFGLARLVQPLADMQTKAEGCNDTGSSMTAPGLAVGTLRYMSPEQARGERVTCAADIFSFGLILYELIGGEHPFLADSDFGVVHAILSNPAAPVSRCNAALSPAWDRLVLAMLEKDATRRPSAAEVEQSLAEIATCGASAPHTAALSKAKHTVGRERERGQLNAAWSSCVAGRGQLWCISGEPGIGKTTLIDDFLTDAVSSGAPCMIGRGQCSERLAGTEAFLPILEALDDLQCQNTVAAEKLKRLAPTWYAQLTATAPAERSSSPDRIRRELLSLLQEISRTQTLALFVDDLQWADISTIDLLSFLGSRLGSIRLLILVAYRPSDFIRAAHPFLQIKRDLQSRGVAHEIQLDFLSRSEIDEFLALDMPVSKLPPELPALIHAKTEGSPLFMADLVSYLRTCGVLAEEEGCWVLARPLPDTEREMPESIRAMIERKIAQLDEQDHRMLAGASVQGCEFDSTTIARALELDENVVEERLEALERVHAFVRFVEEIEFSCDAVGQRYRFTHVLYQNALYATLRATRRTALSKAVAETLLGLYGEQSGAVASELARLFETGREFARAAAQYLASARRASRMFALTEAAALARQGLSVLRSAAPRRERREVELSLYLVLGNALLAIRGYDAAEVEQVYARARELCSELGRAEELLPALYGLWVFHLIHVHLKEALRLGGEFLRLAQEIQSPAILVGHRMVGCPLFYEGRLVQARPYFEEASALYSPGQHRRLAWLYGQEPGVTVETYLALTMWLLGFVDQAAAHNREVLRMGREVEHALSRGHALFFAAAHAHFRREWAELQSLSDELVAFAEDRELTFWLAAGLILQGRMMARAGDIAGGVQQMKRALSSWDLLNHTYLRCVLAEACVEAELSADGLLLLENEPVRAERDQEHLFDAELYRLGGELLLQRAGCDAEAEAERCFEKAIEISSGQETKSLELRAVTSLCRLWNRQNRRIEAEARLFRIYDWFTEGRDTSDLKEAAALLAELRAAG